MIKVTLFVLGLTCACAFTNFNDTNSAGAYAGNAAIAAQVLGERVASQSFLDIMLSLQHAQHWSIAGTNFNQAYLKLATNPNPAESRSLEEDEADFEESFLEIAAKLNKRKAHKIEAQNLEEFTALPFAAPQVPVQSQQTPDEQVLLGAYHLYYGLKLEFFRTLYQAADLQESYWAARTAQLSAQASGALTVPQTQLLYLLSYKTQLDTLKLSYKLQVEAFFSMWLEDELEAGIAKVDGLAGAIGHETSEELIRDKEYAFNAYNTYAILEFQIFYLNMYLKSAGIPTAAAANNAANANVAMLEEEEQAEPSTSTFFAPGAGGAGFYQYFTYMKMYQTLLQMYGAQAALTGVNAEKVAYEKKHDDDQSNDNEALESEKFAYQMYASFGQNIAQAAQIEQLVATFGLWSLYSPAFQPQQPAASSA